MNTNKELTKSDLINYIKKYKNKGYYDFLGFVENRELTSEVESYFTCTNRDGIVACWDWVNGNDKLKKLIEEVE